jgi:Pectate lyase superfamily protein
MINVKDPPYNAVGDGLADDTNAINAAIADLAETYGGLCYVPSGIYKINPNGLTIAANVRLIGEGKGATTLRASGDCQHDYDGFLHAWEVDAWSVRDLTLDMGGFLGTGIKAFLCARWDVTGCEIVNIKNYGIMAQAGTDWRIDANYLVNLQPTGKYQNAAIFCTEAGSNQCGYYYVTGNRVTGSGIIAVGHDGVLSQNVVTGNQYGSGIFSTGDSERLTISENIASGGRGRDVNRTWIEGYELWGRNHIIQGNVAHNNDGGGLSVGAKNSVISGNVAYNNGVATGYGGINLRYIDENKNASGSVVIGNRAYDSQGARATQGYGLVYQNALMTRLVVEANNWNGNKLGQTHTN